MLMAVWYSSSKCVQTDMKSQTLAKKYHFWFIQVNDVRTRFELYSDAMTAWNTTTKGVLCRGDGAVYDWKPWLPDSYTGMVTI
jgi:hypothetical protein